MKLILMRHGETTWNRDRRMQGQADSPLSDLGEAQAAAMEKPMAKIKIAKAYSSDLQRAYRTAELMGFPEAERDPIWREIDVGVWQGEMYADKQASEPENLKGWVQGDWAPEGAENWEVFSTRVGKAIEKVLAKGGDPEEGAICVFCHGLVIKSAVVQLLKADKNLVAGPSNCSMTEFEFREGEAPRMLRFNHVGHDLKTEAAFSKGLT